VRKHKSLTEVSSFQSQGLLMHLEVSAVSMPYQQLAPEFQQQCSPFLHVPPSPPEPCRYELQLHLLHRRLRPAPRAWDRAFRRRRSRRRSARRRSKQYRKRTNSRILLACCPRRLGSCSFFMLASSVTSSYLTETYFPRTKVAWTVKFMIIKPLARSMYGRISSE
jgi:hypothetical protein